MPSLRLCDPVLIVGMNKLGLAMHNGMGELGFRNLAIWCPNHQPCENKSIIKLFDRHMTKVFWGHDTPERVYVATIVALDVHPGTVWPLRFGKVLRVPDVVMEYPLSPHLNDARRILAGFPGVGKDVGFDDTEIVTLFGLPVEDPDDVAAEYVFPQEVQRPKVDALFPNGRKSRPGEAASV